MEMNFGCHLCIGPPLQNGFYYDAYMGEDKVHESDFEKIDKIAEKIINEKQAFERIVLTKEQAI